ncbi:hypothetical protein RSAG8_09625, partial [Rhizoctonia solani AG-8 WAC10335]
MDHSVALALLVFVYPWSPGLTATDAMLLQDSSRTTGNQRLSFVYRPLIDTSTRLLPPRIVVYTIPRAR